MFEFSNRDVVRQWAVTLSVIGTIIINGLSQAIPFNGQTSAEIANRFQNFFLPANYVFSIWSIIYVGLIAFTFFQSRPSQRENPRLRATGWWFVISCVANSIWLFLFHYEQFWLSTVAMLVLLFSLVKIYLGLRDGSAISNAERWTTRATFSIYIGWITVATVANFTYALIAGGWDGFGISQETWGAIILVVAGLIAGSFAYLNRDVAYAAVIVWAFVGIIARHPAVMPVALAAGVMAAAVGIAALVRWISRNSGSPLQPSRA